MNLAQNEKLKWTRLFDLNQDILIATNQGFIARISGDSLSSLGRSAHGVKAIKMRNEDFVIDMDIVHNNKTNESKNHYFQFLFSIFNSIICFSLL